MLKKERKKERKKGIQTKNKHNWVPYDGKKNKEYPFTTHTYGMVYISQQSMMKGIELLEDIE